MVGLTRLELVTSRLSAGRSNQLSYRPIRKKEDYLIPQYASSEIRNFFCDSPRRHALALWHAGGAAALTKAQGLRKPSVTRIWPKVFSTMRTSRPCFLRRVHKTEPKHPYRAHKRPRSAHRDVRTKSWSGHAALVSASILHSIGVFHPSDCLMRHPLYSSIQRSTSSQNSSAVHPDQSL